MAAMCLLRVCIVLLFHVGSWLVVSCNGNVNFVVAVLLCLRVFCLVPAHAPKNPSPVQPPPVVSCGFAEAAVDAFYDLASVEGFGCEGFVAYGAFLLCHVIHFSMIKRCREKGRKALRFGEGVLSSTAHQHMPRFFFKIFLHI